MPLGLRLQHLRADGGGEFVADYSRDYYKTTVIIQQFSSPYTPATFDRVRAKFNAKDGDAVSAVART